MFDSLTSRFGTVFSSLRSRGKISKGDIDDTCAEIRQALLESDVALEVVESFIAEIAEKSTAALATMQPGTNQANAIFEIVNTSLADILGGQARRVRFSKNPPTVIMLAGLQGAGKTTLAGKLAKFYSDQGNTPLLVASDLQRPNAVTQLQVVGQSIGVPVFAPEPGNGVGDPVKVAKAGVEFAKAKQYNMVIVDTAGRLGVDADLMKQASDIRDAVKPDEILFVVDAMTGQDAVRTSKAFLDGVGFDGVVLTKLDGDARGGAALSITSLTQRPIMFVSTGEKTSEFDIFYPDRMASRILGMGDVATLAEAAKKAFDGDTSAKLEAKFASGEDFTLEDFLEQLTAMSKMGSMSKLLGMLPGSGAMKKQIENFDEGEIVRTKAIVQSMTPIERRDPKVLNGSRRARIALGSGRKVSDVNNLVDRFSAAQKMMKQVRNGGMPAGMAGMGMPAMAPPKPSIAPKKKSKSGNPAKRALEESQ
ncbi:MAG: signal recognition particle protein [Actinobacteria bacterium]|jgi:signal recognition particle subunit SRP54|uniref:signal-recognition-particle GTPase n=1 Tax=freshwater metagenome TaxID=449393 RepID=A0A6J6T5X8_9ZZZZ|nr:signal recognition particle protein [Actinomycetota bacterium]